MASIMTRRDTKGVRLHTRNGNDFSQRFPLVVAAVAALPARACLIAAAGGQNLLASFSVTGALAPVSIIISVLHHTEIKYPHEERRPRR
jgi:hypothetical protein